MIPPSGFASTLFWRTDLQGVNGDVLFVATVSPAQILRSCLIDLGLVSYPGVISNLPPCFISSLPDSPDVCIRIKDTAGRLFGREARTGVEIIHPGVQIVIRHFAKDYSPGWLLANQIKDALDQDMFPIQTQVPEDGSDHYIQNVIRTSGVIDLGEEIGTQRQLWSINARIAFMPCEPSVG